MMIFCIILTARCFCNISVILCSFSLSRRGTDSGVEAWFLLLSWMGVVACLRLQAESKRFWLDDTSLFPATQGFGDRWVDLECYGLCPDLVHSHVYLRCSRVQKVMQVWNFILKRHGKAQVNNLKPGKHVLP
ncbi:uncharacterized protein LOC114915989 [Cajanus cajan]|uniref:uncharacterized protein LOC114915989 n=1 Tax=Cajanus cajan TaxID=3821 RepID=UPI0010FAFD6A|nr:uncharacterized protein LOC114915989 [Cajanus cajan]